MVKQLFFFAPSISLHLKLNLLNKMASIFDGIEQGPPIEVFALNKAFLEDQSPDKVNLGVGGKQRV